MLQGAIIGLVVGLTIAVVQYFRQKKGGTKVMAALRAGGPEARAALDGYVPPPSGKVAAGKLANYFERFSWLAIIGDLDTLERESASVQGMLSVRTQLQVMALMGLLGHRSEQRDVDALEQVAAHIEQEGGALLKLVKKQAADARSMARAMVRGEPLDTQARQRLAGRANQSGPATKAVIFRFLARASEASGQDPRGFRQLADEALAKLQG